MTNSEIINNIGLKNDILFKAFFTKKGNEKFLKSFLEAVLKIKIEEIEAVGEATVIKDYEKDKQVRLDIKARINNNEIIDIEMQLVNEHNIEKRSTYYGAKLISRQIETGEDYKKLKPVILINILNYNILDVPEYINKTVTVLEKHREYEMIKDVTYYFIELSKFRESKPRVANLLESWLTLIDSDKEGVIGMVDENKIKIIEEAKKELEKMLEEDPAIRELIEAREDGLRDYNSAMNSAKEIGMQEGMEEGRKKGIKEGRKEEKEKIAKEMKKEKISTELIIKITGLTKDKIESL